MAARPSVAAVAWRWPSVDAGIAGGVTLDPANASVDLAMPPTLAYSALAGTIVFHVRNERLEG